MPVFPSDAFKISLEIVPPADHDIHPLMNKLQGILHLPFDGFSVASNPVAKPRMSAMAFAHLLQRETGKPAILHMTVRDQNRIGLQAELLGARALDIDTILAVSGDPSTANPGSPARSVNDLTVFELIRIAGESGLSAGAVLDFRPEIEGLSGEIPRVKKKAEAGCGFIVTQPVYDRETALKLKEAMAHIGVPVILGILPLLSFRHAKFLHEKVAGIAVPPRLMTALETSEDPCGLGIENSCQMLDLARKYFSGACIMPPFDRFDIVHRIL